jgi:peptidoglycan/LPS O-acetylase OafA/YrhL
MPLNGRYSSENWMLDLRLSDINWFASSIGFAADLFFTQVVGLVLVSAMLAVQGVSLGPDDVLPSDAELVYQIVGVIGAFVGGSLAGFVARRKGSLHGVLSSVIGLVVLLCALPLFGNPTLSIGDGGFIVLNLIAAGYGGGFGERLRTRRDDGREPGGGQE